MASGAYVVNALRVVLSVEPSASRIIQVYAVQRMLAYSPIYVCSDAIMTHTPALSAFTGKYTRDNRHRKGPSTCVDVCALVTVDI